MKDVSNNSIALNTFNNTKRANQEAKQIPERDQKFIEVGNLLSDKAAFISRRNQKSSDFRMSHNGKFICEKVQYASKDE